MQSVPEYNIRQKKWATRICTQGGRRQINSHIWFAGGILPDGSEEEFDNDLSFPISEQPSTCAGSLFTYDIADIDAVTAPLGVPWAMEKDQPFSEQPVYIGFYWDICSRRVGIPDKKKEKYWKAINIWLSAEPPLHTLKETQELHGKLQHAASCSIRWSLPHVA